MQQIVELTGNPAAGNGRILLWIVLGLGFACLAWVLSALIGHEERRHRHHTPQGKLGRLLTRPYRRIRAYLQAVSELHRQRVQFRKWTQPRRRRRSRSDREPKSDSGVDSV